MQMKSDRGEIGYVHRLFAASTLQTTLPEHCAPSTSTKQSGSLTGIAVPVPEDLLLSKAADNYYLVFTNLFVCLLKLSETWTTF